ncbi:mechanosensitive ion channel family protein [Erythrobacter sp. JK5]|uniref:mechanosensitive ion channel family protein n=1 Tax=Erythrobacter sp. JK5 TaxID=2829500 RepID=UPI001BAD61BE|nr:mechanosensitive ion channel domain-containing protein [Erythrobacter sp. JK5]QUL36525.1 mechanosensitive ion channel [Erythrobacter sp. JK5]
MTAAATPQASPTDAVDPATAPGAAADGAVGEAASVAPPTTGPTPEPTPEPTPTEVVEGTGDLVEGVSQQSETAGAFLQYLDTLALETSQFRVSVLDALLVIGVILLVITVAWLLSRLSGNAVDRFTRFDKTQKLLAEKISTIVIWGAAFFIGIDLIGIDLTTLAFFGGAFGLAIGFGLQKTFGNLIAGIILLMDKSIKPGDVIAVADTVGNETFGEIRKIGIRAVSVTTRDRREYLIPNENLMINQVENWSYSSKEVRMQVNVGVSYSADMDQAEQLMLEAARSTKRVLTTPPPEVWMAEYGDSSVNFIVHCWIRDPELGVGNVRSDVLKNLWKLFRQHDVEIPFPQRDINLRDNEQLRALLGAIDGRVATDERQTGDQP